MRNRFMYWLALTTVMVELVVDLFLVSWGIAAFHDTGTWDVALACAIRGALYAVAVWYAVQRRNWGRMLLIILDVATVLITGPVTAVVVAESSKEWRYVLAFTVPVVVYYSAAAALAWFAFRPSDWPQTDERWSAQPGD